MVTNSVTERLKIALNAAGKDWADLGRCLKVTRAGYKKWRDGDAEPTGKNLLGAADFLDVRLRWLIAGELPMRQQGTLSDEEEQLVDAYRQLSPDDRKSLLRHAVLLTYNGEHAPTAARPYKATPTK
jgi:transcriptional regulator with XRE-family HTH domain